MRRPHSQRELEQKQQHLEYQSHALRVFVADIVEPNQASKTLMEERMEELKNLVHTYGGIVIVQHIQQKTLPDYNTFVGAGKLDMIISEMEQKNADILIIGNILKAHQIYKINEKLRNIGAKAWDRIDLILKIFEKNAQSREAKLQIELAAIKHMGPRIFGMGMELSKQGAGTGTRGKGETNTEIMKRHLRKKEEHIKKELIHFKKVREQHRKSRKRKGLPTIGIVGYTNAGKSTLTNALTNKGVLAEDKLFATLGTSVGKMWIPNTPLSSEQETSHSYGIEVLINDTIGFIRDLPPNLIDAFSSTLEDSIESDILLHVIDTNDPKIEEKITIVDTILEQIGATQKKLYVFNKIDQLGDKNDNEKTFEHLKPIFISAGKKIGLDDLKIRIKKELIS